MKSWATDSKESQQIGEVTGSFDCAHCRGRHDLAKEIECLRNEGRLSISLLQRRFRLGYHHASGIFEAMVTRGLITPKGEPLIPLFSQSITDTPRQPKSDVGGAPQTKTDQTKDL